MEETEEWVDLDVEEEAVDGKKEKAIMGKWLINNGWTTKTK
jgi:hypothetical protein